MPEPEISGTNIVLIGSFNPKIFQPEWFLRQNLLPTSEAEAADIKVVHPEICFFETERFVIQVTSQRFLAASKTSANAEPLRDLVSGTFFILEHTPASAMGLNTQMHFQLSSEADWHKLGDNLAPKDGWASILSGRPGMLSLTVQSGADPANGSRTTVKIEPSVRLKFGAYFEINENYPAQSDNGLKELMDILRGRWAEAQTYAGKIASHILKWAVE